MKDLKEKAIRGGLARFMAQGADFSLRLLSLTVLARLLNPKDFGLVGMVTAFTGVLMLFRDFGLSAAVIQHGSVTEDQLSNLFWINVLVGAVLALLLAAGAPVMAAFYHEPRLRAVTAVLALSFLFNAVGIQHGAMLQREMRFTAVAVINTLSLVTGVALAIGGSLAGYGYWALVAMTVTGPLVASSGFWIATGWVPGRPRRRTGIRSLMRFGGTVTLNGLVVYVGSNFEKVLLGRYWGADAIGLYGRAFQLVNIPTANLNTAAGEVAFAGLSRVQDDGERLRRYFLRGYSLILAMTVPLTLLCSLFSPDVIRVFLGPKWGEAAPIFRYLAPTILVFAIANPLSWLLMSLGMISRLLKMGLVIAPIMIASYLVGLPYGPTGVALAYSTVMALWLFPLIAWALHGTPVSFRDILATAYKPLACGIVAAGLAFAVRTVYGHSLPPFPRLALESLVLLGAFSVLLLFVAGQKSLYLDLFRGLMKRPPVEDKGLVAA
ncbi:MAG TPA: lipopolysaccharide biosynthesis protein [Candidatus Eisenbacteria bacterium]|nr:lipopolysaccharide biosynthesis protein [Candidatus Eisenbacteria bacterium]